MISRLCPTPPPKMPKITKIKISHLETEGLDLEDAIFDKILGTLISEGLAALSIPVLSVKIVEFQVTIAQSAGDLH